MANTIDERIEEIAQKPQTMTVDGVTVSMPNVKDLAEVSSRKAAKTAGGKSHMGLRIVRIKSPDALGM